MNASLKGVARPAVVGVAAIAVLVIVAALIIRQEAGPQRRDREEVTVFCDSAMSAVMNGIIDVFHRRSSIQINTRFGPSEDLLEEFTNDPAAVDLFLPGGAVYLERAGEHIVEATPLAWAVPVMLVQLDNPEGIESVEDLGRPGLELALPDGDVTAMGGIIPRILEHHGLTMEDIQPNIALSPTTEAELTNAVRLGRVDAAITWEPVARRAARCEVVSIPLEEDIVTELAIGLSAESLNPDSAREFASFLQGSAARALFERYAYALTRPEPGEDPSPDESGDDEIMEEVFGLAAP
ncbi:MAG: substrate-binding domain-containing protein [Candidatus Hydrogenedentota bacterium]